ncbi:hypothetical protein ACJOT0_24765, partial [Nocardiopsis sp. frass2]
MPEVLEKVLLLEQDPQAGYPPGGELTGFRKPIVGRDTWRAVHRVTEDKNVEICEVRAVGGDTPRTRTGCARRRTPPQKAARAA